jgi:hypothetical protein
MYSHQKRQTYRLCINNNLDYQLLEVCLFAAPGNQRASRVVYMQPKSNKTLDLSFCCAEIKACSWLDVKKEASALLLNKGNSVDVYINKKDDGTLAIDTQVS